MEAMRFGGAIQRILKQLLTADPRLGPVYLSKVDLADAYMRLWVSMEDVPTFAVLIPKKNTSNTQLEGFHLSLPMGYIDSAPYFCMETETVTDLTNEKITLREQAEMQPLDLEAEDRAADNTGAPTAKMEAIWVSLPADQRSAATKNVIVCLDD